jgi:hypothetical protein
LTKIRLRGHRRLLITAAALLLAGLGAVTARLFVWPAQGMPARVDAIVMLNGTAGRLAQRYHWRSIALVTTTPQDTRARLRVRRCFPGNVYVVTAPLPARQWPYAVTYEWGATIRALLLQPGC